MEKNLHFNPHPPCLSGLVAWHRVKTPSEAAEQTAEKGHDSLQVSFGSQPVPLRSCSERLYTSGAIKTLVQAKAFRRSMER